MINTPLVSIILPIRNEEERIELTLRAILTQDYLHDRIELIIVDGMSTDNTREIIKFFSENLYIHLLDNPGQIVPTGMNIGLRHATGDVIIRIDGHTVIATDYVRQCVDTIQRTNADNVGGCMTAKGNTLLGEVVAIATSNKFGIGNSKFHYSRIEEEVDSVYMGAWKKTVFEKIGLFDEELIRDQDDEFNYRLKEAGGTIVLNPLIRSEYLVRGTPKSLLKQYFQYGYYKVRVLQKHPKQMSLRQFIPPAFVFMVMVSIIFSIVASWGWILFSLVVGSYLIANLTASYISVVKNKPQSASLLPLAYAIIHIGYGAGFLCGLVKFWNRWGDKKGQTPSY